jgi:hypothetical protein
MLVKITRAAYVGDGKISRPCANSVRVLLPLATSARLDATEVERQTDDPLPNILTHGRAGPLQTGDARY